MFGVQTVMPAWHGLAGTHVVPAAHAAQFPLWQTMPAPHTVPFGWLPDSMQTGAPVLQAVAPLLHGLPGTAQSLPAAQLVHMPPPLHTMSVPQAVPGVTLVLASMQVIAGEHVSVPLWHL